MYAFIGPVFIIVAAFLWALDGIVLRPSLYSLPVPIVVFTEHALAFALMLPFFLYERHELKKIGRAAWGSFFWVALFGGVLGTMFITKALFHVNFVNLSIVVLIQKLQPVFALILAWVVLKEKLPKRFWRWAILAIVATYVVTFDGLLPNLNTGEKTTAAALYALGAAFAWGSSTVFGKKALQQVSFRMGTYIRFGLTTAIMAVIVASSTGFGALSMITPSQLTTFGVIVFTSGGVAMFLYYYGLKRVTASVSTICELMFPLSAIMLEFLIHGKVLSVTQWVATAVLLVAVYRVSLLQRTNA